MIPAMTPVDLDRQRAAGPADRGGVPGRHDHAVLGRRGRAGRHRGLPGGRGRGGAPVEAAEQELIDLPIEEPEPEEVLLVRMPPRWRGPSPPGPSRWSPPAGRRARSAVARWTPTATCVPAPTVTGVRASLTVVSAPDVRELLDGPLVGARPDHARLEPHLPDPAGRHGRPVRLQAESGERPLWDFTDGTLADREYAAWLVSEHLGWDVVPPTVLRDGPAGPGHGAALDGAGGAPRARATGPGGRRPRGVDAARLPARRRRERRRGRAGDAGARGLARRCDGWRSST